MLPLKRVFTMQTGVWGEEPEGSEGVQCVRVADFDRTRQTVGDVPTFRALTAAEFAKTRLRAGDLLLEKSGGTDTNPVGFVVRYTGRGPAVCSNFIARLRMVGDHSSRFWNYALAAAYFDGRTWPHVKKTTGIQNLDINAWRAMRVPTPPPDRQRAIADFLDRETAKVDALIEKKNQLIALLRERRRVWHTSVVRHDCGWPRVALRHICHAIVDCPHWTPDVVEESEFEAVRSGCIREGQYRPEAALLVDEVVYHARNRGTRVEEGDVLFAREAPAGEACLVPAGRNLCLGQRTVLLKVDRAQIAPELVLANLYSQEVQDRFQVEMHGSTVGNLRLPVIRGTTIVVPPRSEQARLVKDFVEGIARIDALIAKAEEFIVLAKERRAALITAAVTGQIDVTGGTS